MDEQLGKATLDLQANLEPFRRNMREAEDSADAMQHTLDALAAVSKIAEEAIKKIKMSPGQGAEARTSAEGIIRGVRGISDEARKAAVELDRVKLTDSQAAESNVAADEMSHGLNKVSRNARQARRDLDEVRLAGGRNGVGVGIFGSGFGRIGLMGAGIGLGTLAAPAAAPGAVGLLASIPALAGAAGGAAGVLALALDGVGKAIGGDKKAFDKLQPSAQKFVVTVRSLTGFLDQLKQRAGASLFPGLTAGLTAALSPGTVNAITTAITELGRALGSAGEQWGRYFGSPQFQQIFGPLMLSGARTVGTLSDALLHLVDAIGVVARAAIPLTNWINDSIDKGARFADAWLNAKAATGQLSGAMTEAQTSLRLVAGLFEALLRAVGSLGTALYPVSKIAVKDLTDGLNALAGIIDRNRQTIRDIVAGALAALVSTVRTLTPIVSELARALLAVVHAVGGWKVAFEFVIGGVLASKLTGILGGVVGVGGAAETAKAEVTGLRAGLMALGSTPVIAALAAVAASVAAIYNAFNTPGSSSPNTLGGGGSTNRILTDANGDRWLIGARGQRLKISNSYGVTSVPASSERDMRGAQAAALANAKYGSTGYYKSLTAQAAAAAGIPVDLFSAQINQESGFNPNAVSGAGAQGIAQFMPSTARGLGVNPHDPQSALNGAARLMASYYRKYGRWDLALAAYNGGPGAVDYYLKHGYFPTSETTNYVSAILGAAGIPSGAEPGSSPFGTEPPFTKSLGSTKPPAPPVIPNSITSLLNMASANASKSKQLGNLGGTATRYLQNELDDLDAADAALKKLVPKNARDRQQIAAKETEVENKIRDVQTLIKNAAFLAGDALLPPSLRAKLTALTAKFKADSTYSQVLTGKAAEDYAKTLEDDINGQATVLTAEVAVLKQKLAGATGKQRTAIQAELMKVQGQLANVQQQVVQTLQSDVQTLQQHVAAAFAGVQQQLLAQLGGIYFQGGLQTPLEQQLAQMQAQDTANSLQDALQQAKDQKAADLAASASAISDATGAYNDAAAQLATAQASPDSTAADIEQFKVALSNAKSALDAVSDPGKTQQQISLDQKQIDQAQRAIDENNLAIRAAAERAQLDAEYATKSQDLTDKLSKLADQFQNGTGTMSDLATVASAFGLTLNVGAVPAVSDLTTALGDSNSGLVKALHDLASYIEKLTGQNPATGAGSGPSSSSGPNLFGTQDPGIAAVLGVAASTSAPDALARYLVGHAIPMAGGGFGRAKLPTLFYSNGNEDYAFSGEGRSFADAIGSRPGALVVEKGAIQVNGSLIQERDLQTTIVRALQDYQRRGGRISGFSTN